MTYGTAHCSGIDPVRSYLKFQDNFPAGDDVFTIHVISYMCTAESHDPLPQQRAPEGTQAHMTGFVILRFVCASKEGLLQSQVRWTAVRRAHTSKLLTA
jgi:hypothetical protein